MMDFYLKLSTSEDKMKLFLLYLSMFRTLIQRKEVLKLATLQSDKAFL